MGKFGVIGYATAGVGIWNTIIKCHSRCVKAYCGLPNYVGYSTVCNALGIKNIKDELLAFGKKRLCAIAAFSPFGPEIMTNRQFDATGIYKSPSEVLLNDNEAR